MKAYLLVFIICIFLFVAKTSFAETSISLSPSKTKISLYAGKSTNIHFIIQNKADPIYVSVDVSSLEPESIYGKAKLIPEKANGFKFTLKDQDQSLGDSLLLHANEKRDFDLQVSTSQTILPGDYYFAFVEKSVVPKQVSGSVSARINGIIVSPIIISVNEDRPINYEAKITDVSIISGFTIPFSSLKIIDSFSPLKTRIVAQNYGKYNVTASGSVAIKGPFTKRSFIIAPQMIARQTQKLITTDTHKDNASLIMNGFKIGKITVSAKIAFPSSLQTGSASFFAFPFKLLGFFILGTFFLLYFLKRRMH